MIADETKFCKKCGLSKPKSEFNKNKTKKDGLNSYCKLCHCADSRKWAKENPEIVKANQAEWRSENREKLNVANVQWQKNNPVKRRKTSSYCGAKVFDGKRGFNTCTRKEFYKILDIGVCFYCGFSGPIGADRIDNSKGHEVGNMLPCCTICNRTRSDVFTVQEMKGVIGPAFRKIREARLCR